MGMAPNFAKLKNLSIEELEQLYDQEAKDTVTGTNFYLAEIARRVQDHQASLMLLYTKRMLWLTIIIGIFTLANLAATAVPYLKIFGCSDVADLPCQSIEHQQQHEK